jgi:hypothetical protein
MGSILKTKGGLVIDRPGHVLFVPVKADGTLDYANAVRNTAVINTITITNSKTKTDIPDGNSFYPAGDRVTAIAGTVAIEFSTVDPAIWAMSSGTAVENTQTDSMIKMYEYLKIGESNTIVLDEQYKTNGFVKVVGSDGTEFEKASTTPEAGEFSIAYAENKTTLTFAAADAGKNVAITMEMVASTMSYGQDRSAMKYHKLIIDTEYSTLNDSEKIPVNFIISQASISGDMVDALQKDPSATKTLTYTMYAPLPGEKPYEVKFLNKTE